MTNVIALLGILVQYLDKIGEIKALLSTAHSEGRDVTDAELDVLFAGDDAARAALQAAIDAARAAQPAG